MRTVLERFQMQVGCAARDNEAGLTYQDLIIVLREGRVAEQGTHEELLAIEDGVYRNLWNAQLTESTTSGEAAVKGET